MHSEELSAALDFARLGGEIALFHYGRNPEASRKHDGTWVTEADREVEARVRAAIAARFPAHNILGEEEGLAAAKGGPAVAGAPTWVIDPIDGTNNYIAGIPIWATLVGLRSGEESVVGVAHAPALGETYDGAAGLGARCNGEPIRVDPVGDLGSAMLLFAGTAEWSEAPAREFFDRLTRSAWRTRGLGDFWGHMLVARGAAHIMMEAELSVWDVVALQPIVAEAGGKLTHLDGTTWADKGSCLTTNGVLHETVVALVKETGAR